MTFLQITSPTDGARLYIELRPNVDNGNRITCVLSEPDMTDMVMCRFRGLPDDDWKDMLNGFELIEYELQDVFCIQGDVSDLACKIYDRMKETKR